DAGALPSFPTRRSSDLASSGHSLRRMNHATGMAQKSPAPMIVIATDAAQDALNGVMTGGDVLAEAPLPVLWPVATPHAAVAPTRSEEHTSELQSRRDLV